MPQARGSDLVVAFFEEGTYGVDPGSPAGRNVYVKAFNGPGGARGLLTPETITSNRVRPKPDYGNKNVAFSLPIEISAENSGALFKHALGVVNTTGTGPYTHTITCGALPTGLVIERDFGANVAGAWRYEKFNGCRVASMDVDIPQQGYASAVFNFLGAKSTPGSAPLDASLDSTAHTPFSAASITTMNEGGAGVTNIKSLKFRVENDLDEDGFTINPAAPGVRTQLPEGFSTVTGELVAVFDNATLLNKAVNGTPSTLLVALSRGSGDGSTNNEFISFEASSLVYEQRSPEVPGPKGLVVTLAFRAYDANQFRAVFKNGNGSIP